MVSVCVSRCGYIHMHDFMLMFWCQSGHPVFLSHCVSLAVNQAGREQTQIHNDRQKTMQRCCYVEAHRHTGCWEMLKAEDKALLVSRPP